MNPFCWCVRITVLERLCQIIRSLVLAFLPGLNSRIAQAIRRIVKTVPRNLEPGRGILDRS